jgi:enoyl-[acyl-carrier protein] reductase II
MGSRFVASREATSHIRFKEAVVTATEGGTQLSLKKHVPVRLLKNAFFEQVSKAEARGADREELAKLLGRGRAKRGMFDGDLEEGELEIGQVSAMIREIKPAAGILEEVWSDFLSALRDPLGTDRSRMGYFF